MPRQRSGKPPRNAETIRTYAEFQSLIEGFVSGHFRLLAIVGRPGLSKSFSLNAAMGDEPDEECLMIKGRMTPIRFYENLYLYRDKPVILDDCDSLWADKLCKQYLKALTESDKFRRLDWSTMTAISAPTHFWTSSPVCVITNSWDSKDPICQALESRAEFVYFAPTWEEVYTNAAQWFWDQEIFDYVHKLIPVLKHPDIRILVKAHQRKVANLKHLPWKGVIDNHCLDKAGKAICEILDDPKVKTEVERVAKFEKLTGQSRATYYRKKDDIMSYRPTTALKRLVLKRKTQPKQSRPSDGVMLDGSHDDE